MAKITKEELKSKISELVPDTEIAVTLLEDVEDSFIEPDMTEVNELNQKLSESESKYNDLLEKYKNRFTENIEEKTEEKVEEPTGLQEENIIDVKEV